MLLSWQASLGPLEGCSFPLEAYHYLDYSGVFFFENIFFNFIVNDNKTINLIIDINQCTLGYDQWNRNI